MTSNLHFELLELVMLLLVVTYTLLASIQSDKLEYIISKLEEYEQKFQFYEYNVTYNHTLHDPSSFPDFIPRNTILKNHKIYQADHSQYYLLDEQQYYADGRTTSSKYLETSDGERHIRISHPVANILEKPNLTIVYFGANTPVFLYTFITFPLHVLLKGDEEIKNCIYAKGFDYSVLSVKVIGDDVAKELKCTKVLVELLSTSTSKILITLWFCPDRDYLCIKEEMLFFTNEVQDGFSDGEVFTFRQLEDKTWVPLTGTFRCYSTENDTKKLTSEWKYNLIYRSNPMYPKEFFRTEIPDGLLVYEIDQNNKITKEYTKVSDKIDWQGNLLWLFFTLSSLVFVVLFYLVFIRKRKQPPTVSTENKPLST